MKPTYARSIPLILLTLTAATNSHAQLTILSDNQTVGISGWVSDQSGHITQNYFQTQSTTGQIFPDTLSGNAGGLFYGNPISSGSSATQNSSISSSELSFAGSVSATQTFPAPPGHLYADAYSSLFVTFTVAAPTSFTLTADQHNWDMIDIHESFSLRSSTGTLVLGGPQINGNGSTQFLGILDPDQVYTLQVMLGTRDFLQPDISQNFNVCLTTTDVTPAPEPSSVVLLAAGVTSVGLLALRRKRQGCLARL